MKFQCTGRVNFIFYCIELDFALEIGDENSKVKTNRTEISCFAHTSKSCSRKITQKSPLLF